MRKENIEELNLKITSPHYLSLKTRLDSIKLYIKNNFNKETKIDIVDIGCGSKPYLILFKPFANSYIGVDPNKEMNPDICSYAESVPLKENSFDFAICTQTLEHVKGHKEAIKEMYRVLKNGGTLFLTTHGTYPIHGAPNDYWRFTKYGLEKIFEDFNSVEIVPMGGTILCLFQIINLFFAKLSRIFIVGLLFKPIIVLNNILGWNLDKLFYSDIMPINYLVIAKK